MYCAPISLLLIVLKFPELKFKVKTRLLSLIFCTFSLTNFIFLSKYALNSLALFIASPPKISAILLTDPFISLALLNLLIFTAAMPAASSCAF